MRRISHRSSINSCSSTSSIEYFNIWDNANDLELKKRGLDVENLDNSPQKSFFRLFKARFCLFPNQNDKIENKDITDYSKKLVGKHGP